MGHYATTKFPLTKNLATFPPPSGEGTVTKELLGGVTENKGALHAHTLISTLPDPPAPLAGEGKPPPPPPPPVFACPAPPVPPPPPPDPPLLANEHYPLPSFPEPPPPA